MTEEQKTDAATTGASEEDLAAVAAFGKATQVSPDNSYAASQIQVLEGMEAVRKRPAMYIGDTFVRGYHHCVYEVVDNSIDEAMAGFCSHIDVILNADGSCTVTDNGRGIPVDEQPQTHKPALEVVLTVLHAGGKFGNGGYKVSGGLHGVGVSCVNALSDWLEAEVRRGGHIYRIRFSKGVLTQKMTVVGDCAEDDTGTTITFHLDKTIFHTEEGDAYEFQWSILSKRFRELSFLNPGVEIRFSEEATGKHEVYLHKDGIVGYVRSLNANKPPITPQIVSVRGAEDGVSVEVALQYVQEKYDESIFSFANNINTIEGGTHLTGFCTALTSTVNDYARRNGFLKDKEENLSGEDIREGITCVISVKVPNPQFEGQTKTKLGNSNVAGIVQLMVNREMKDYFEENPKVAAAIVTKSVNSQRARVAARKARETVRKETGGGMRFLGKLADCSSRNPEECELFLVEGDSAGGSAKQGRDRRTQAILPLRGKVLNVQKARIDRMLDNNEIKSLISAIGGGFGNSDFDVTKIRYHKVVIMTDADVDGAHIRTLLLTFFYNQMRPLIEHGHVYLAQPPLYQIKRKGKEEYIESDAKLTRRLISLGSEEFTFSSADGNHEIEGSQMPELLELLASAEDLCRRLAKQNVNVRHFFELRNQETGEFPRFRVLTDIDGNPVDHYVFHQDETEKLKVETAEALGTTTEVLDEPENPNYTCTEILQAATLRRQMDTLHEVYHFELGDFWGTGHKIGTLTDTAGQTFDVESLMQFLDIIRTRGRKGLTVQRYKGLGEMDYDQLYDTTMDPGKRKMLKVVLDSGVDADNMFELLMGEEVVPRRRFIEDHALMANIDA